MTVLADLTVSAFDADLASASPAPGGGSAAALAGSIAAALVAMVCRLSLGREDVAAPDRELEEALAESERLRSRLLELVDEDTAAFNAIMAAIRLPKDDDEQRAARSAALGAAKEGAAVPPLETLSAARQTLALAAALAGRTNPNVVSDLGVAVHLGLAAAEGALLNVAINVPAPPAGALVDIAAARAAAAQASPAIAATLGLAAAG